ncbi:DUF6777 domain-containing protein [uncultured Streptomyces sp.]|uniref:DUF6777 domain-containing protein n=1 Tax=uncultured Streptomyces sp. TaxID=174707 RepID=UPI00263A3AD2|nr:DUF6777 domain-containing protein [uncultured Streptomyces sp.]
MRPLRRLPLAVCAPVCGGVLLVAGCGAGATGSANGTTGTPVAASVLLQPARSPGPAPFTASTAGKETVPRPPEPSRSATPTTAPTLLPVSGTAPGLYAATRSVAACDVARQARLLSDDPARGRAFARAAGADADEIARHLRGLTPVVLRADARVTGHGYRDGAATDFQAVLQAGTAVLVDARGVPRVRCACGNPLDPPVAMKGRVLHRGERWKGYDPAKIVVIEAASRPARSLLLADLGSDGWIERRTGDGGAADRTPADPPPYAPGDAFVPGAPATPEPPATPAPEPSTPAPEPSDEPPAPLPPGMPDGPADDLVPDEPVGLVEQAPLPDADAWYGMEAGPGPSEADGPPPGDGTAVAPCGPHPCAG